MPDSWQVVTNGVVIAAITAITFLLVDQPSGRNLTISVALGILAAIVTWWRLRHS